VEYRILGPLEVIDDRGALVTVGAARQRAVLALLLLSADTVVSAESLRDNLFGEVAPEGAGHALRVYVSRLRKVLRDAGQDGVLVTRPPGYVLRIDPMALDAARFDGLVQQGRAQANGGDHSGAAHTLRQALELWRGPALVDVLDVPGALAEATRLEETRLAALEERVEADLACGRHGELVAELDRVTHTQPLRERLWGQRMIALYRGGRQADALRVYQELRRFLGEELGLEPGAAVAALEGAILRHDPALDWQRSPLLPPAVARSSPPVTSGGVVTFLFTDLVGSTGILDRLGEDAFDALRRRHFSLLRAAVADHGGQEVKNLGDGLMVAFTSPLAALRCALAMQQAVEDQNSNESCGALELRVGVHAGEPLPDGDDFFGTAVVVARRLCDLAEGGQVLASEVATRLIGARDEFRFTPLGPLALRGMVRTVGAVDVGRPRPDEPGGDEAATTAAGAGGRIPLPSLLSGMGGIFVGRDAELKRLTQLWKEAAAGERRVALLAGEPGIGKTRLAAELAGCVFDGGGVVLYGRCQDGLGVPYEPFVEAFAACCERTAPGALRARLGRYPGELTRLLPELAELVPGLAAPLRSDPDTEQYRLFQAVASWLSATGEATGVLLIVDDLHWAAPQTLQLLGHLLRRGDAARLMVVGAFRDTEIGAGGRLGRLLADLRRLAGVDRLALDGLTTEDLSGLVGAEEAAPLYEDTKGNPFFVGEVLRDRRESGSPADVRPVPEGVRDVILTRVGRLTATTGDVLTVAAVLGDDFHLAPLAAVARLEPEMVIDALDEALAARLVEETGPVAYRFVHALVRSALHDTVSAARRARLHLAAADQFADDPARTGRHLLAAAPLADPTRTARTCLAAGDRALALLADAEADQWYTQGLAMGSGDSALHIDLLIGLGAAQRRSGHATSRRTLLDAAQLAAGRGDGDRLVRAVLTNSRGFVSLIGDVDDERLELIQAALDQVGPGGDRAKLLALQAGELLYAGDHERVLAAADEAAAIAAEVADDAIRARVGASRLYTCLIPHRVLSVAAEASDVIGFADAAGDPELQILSRAAATISLLAAGHLTTAHQRTLEAMRIADDIGQPGLRSAAHLYHAGTLDGVGHHDEAARLTQTAFELGQEAGWPDAATWYGGRMWVHWTFDGQPDVAAAVTESAVAAYPRWIVWQGARALDLALAGHRDELAGVLAAIPAVLPTVPVDFLWLCTHFVFAIAQGFGVEHPESAGLLYDRLLPWRTLHASYGTGYLGPVELALAVAARVKGDAHGALAHHEAAAAAIDACGAARARALNGDQWARTLLVCGENQRAIEQAEESLAYCRDKGYASLAAKTEEIVAGNR